MQLVVHEPFGDYAKGDPITDPAEVEAVRSGENAHKTTAVADGTFPVAPKPKAKPAKA